MLLTHILYLVHRMERLHVLLPRQEAAEVRREGLAVALHFGIGFIPPYVIQQVCCDVSTGPVGEPYDVREVDADIDEAARVSFVLFHEDQERVKV